MTTTAAKIPAMMSFVRFLTAGAYTRSQSDWKPESLAVRSGSLRAPRTGEARRASGFLPPPWSLGPGGDTMTPRALRLVTTDQRRYHNCRCPHWLFAEMLRMVNEVGRIAAHEIGRRDR